MAAIDEVFGTTPKEKALGAALVAKENMSPAEADALDWQTYNKKLVMSCSKNLQSYENRHFVFRTCYNGKQVFATETNGSKTSRPLNGIMSWTTGRYFANLGQIGVELMPGTLVRDGQGGGRLPELSFVPLALVNRPGLEGCNTRNDPWPSAVITIGVARTLPELIDDSKYYFTDPKSPVNFCLGIKVYCPTQQMVAFLRERHPDGDGTATLTWALTFGAQPIGQSSIDVLTTEGVSQVLGLDSSCTGPGIEAFKLLLKKERFFAAFAAFEPRMAGELVQHMDRDVELDFYDMQQWCLGGLTNDWTLGPCETPEEAARASNGSDEMLESAYKQTGLFAFYKGPDYVYKPPEPEIEIEVPANLKPIKLPAKWIEEGKFSAEGIERLTRFDYITKMQDKARKEARAREEASCNAGGTSASEKRNKGSKRAKK